MNTITSLFTGRIENRADIGARVYRKSLEVLREAQYPEGGTSPSFEGSRYAGNIYPRDHAYAILAYTSAGLYVEAKKALTFILTAERSANEVLFQRYGQDQKSSSNKPPQIDGNALTVLALADYVRKTGDTEFAKRHRSDLEQLLSGLSHSLNTFPKGDLIFGINGNIEFAPYEEGFELYTNACAVAAFRDAGELFSGILNDATYGENCSRTANRLRDGMANYLYIPEYGGFVPLIRREPNPSVVEVANLTAFQALTDFVVFPLDDERIRTSMAFHLAGTKNELMAGYNRYAASIGRHNFGNGPWPREMLRQAWYFARIGDSEQARECLDWCLHVALLNEEVPLGLPEHVVPREEMVKEYNVLMRTFDVIGREERKKEYEKNIGGVMDTKYGVCYPVNPLVWSHAMFVIVWNEVGDKL
ncbi:MAG: hypothetical protein N2691_02855 [Patescibacteria group bacterium]|nr:hypothetical protein [Patescibacteria group bacterium]